MAKKKSVVKNSAKKSKKLALKTPKFDYKKLASKPKLSLKQGLSLAIVAGVIILGLSGWVWWTKIVINPDRVLNDAIANNLQTTSVTRQVVQDDGSQKVEQTSYLSFYAPTITAETRTRLTQSGKQRQDAIITTDTIGNSNADYVRYVSVEGAENLPGTEGFEKLLGIWAKKEADTKNGQRATFLNESLFSVVPVGNLKPEARQELIEMIEKKDLYKYKLASRKIENYRPVYIYSLSISPADLIEVLAKYAELTGAIDSAQFDPKAYADAPNVSLELTVDIASRNITSILYSGSNRTENYSGYNLYRDIDLPTDTITIDELQQRLQGDNQPSQTNQSS